MSVFFWSLLKAPSMKLSTSRYKETFLNIFLIALPITDYRKKIFLFFTTANILPHATIKRIIGFLVPPVKEALWITRGNYGLFLALTGVF